MYGVCTEVSETSTLFAPCETDSDCTLSNDELCTCFSKPGNAKDAVKVCIPQTQPVGYHNAESVCISLMKRREEKRKEKKIYNFV